MKKLLVFLMVAGFLVAGSGLAQADPSWLTTPILGYDSSYDGNVNIISGPVTTVIPHSFLVGDPLYGTGSPSMSVFTVGQEVHTGSGVYVDDGVTYGFSAVFNDLTNPGRSISYLGGSFVGSGGFWMTWNTPDGGGDAGGIPALTAADIGNWTYVETYTWGTGLSLSSTTDFEVRGVPEPATMLLLGLGLLGLAGVRRKL